ncbi:MAG TPA: GIY-YIG nuclease family protein [Planctomycetota bacterium]
MGWRVYVLESVQDGSTYVGSTTDPERRLAQHNGERAGGARRTRAGRPWRLAAIYGPFDGRADAARAEHEVKRLRGRARLAWPDRSDAAN